MPFSRPKRNAGLELVVLRATAGSRSYEKSIEVVLEDQDGAYKTEWIPKSQLHHKPTYDGNEVALVIPRWLAEKLGANYEEYDPNDWGAEEDPYEPLDFS